MQTQLSMRLGFREFDRLIYVIAINALYILRPNNIQSRLFTHDLCYECETIHKVSFVQYSNTWESIRS